MSRHLARIVMSLALLGSAACISVSTPRFMKPAPDRLWGKTLDSALALASTGRAIEADSVLGRFQRDYPGTEGAREALYWRSLVQLQSGFVSENGPVMLLSRYLSDRHGEHLVEAATLHRISSRVDSLAKVANSLATKVQISNGDVVAANNRAADAKADAKAVVADASDKDAELKRLRSELASAKEELERIKKRLAEPPKKPPVL